MKVNSIFINGKLELIKDRWFVKAFRSSGAYDTIPVFSLNPNIELKPNCACSIKGEIVSRYYLDNNNVKHLSILVGIKNILYSDVEFCNSNFVNLYGTIVKDVICRQTPKGKIISEFVIKIKDDACGIVPCIAWGSLADWISSLNKGTKIYVYGRLQSRNYTKMVDGKSVVKTTYEVSANSIGS